MSKSVLYIVQRVIGQHFEFREWFPTVQKQISKFRGVMYILSIRTVFLAITVWSYVQGLWLIYLYFIGIFHGVLIRLSLPPLTWEIFLMLMPARWWWKHQFCNLSGADSCCSFYYPPWKAHNSYSSHKQPWWKRIRDSCKKNRGQDF